jgi:hypothetical protein
VTNAGKDVGAVLLNAHAAAAAIALLPPPKLAIDKFQIDVEACRQSGNKGDEALAV